MESAFKSQKPVFDRLVPQRDIVVLQALIAIGAPACTKAVKRRLKIPLSHMTVHQRLRRLHEEHKLIERHIVFIQEDLLLMRHIIWEVPSETALDFAAK